MRILSCGRVRMGDNVELIRAQGLDGTWYVEGLHEDLQSFICKIAFED